MAKQSEHIENRFRQAAENISVPPNPLAWAKMEELLDKEYRRKPIAFWWYLLFFCLLGAGGMFTYQLLQKSADKTVVSVNSLPASSSENANNRQQVSKVPAGSSLAESTGQTVPSVTNNGNTPFNYDAGTTGSVVGKGANSVKPGTALTQGKTSLLKTPIAKPFSSPGKLNTSGDKNRLSFVKRNARSAGSKSSGPGRVGKQGRNTKSNMPISDLTNEETLLDAEKDKTRDRFLAQANDTSAADLEEAKRITTARGEADQVQDSATKIKTTVNALNDSAEQAQIKLKPTDGKWKIDRGLNFSVIGKLDATSLHHISLHEFKTLFGISLGYRFSNRLSVQSGMFIQRALYAAGPEDYTVKAGTYLSTYKISKIEANCLFYEIPLNVRYDFLIGKGIRFYSSAGFNSYIMKKENYIYHATGTNGYRMLDSTYTSNKNVFASVYLSAGVEKKITPSFSVQLEPYVTLPNSGLGAGKVKLYSSGFQVSLKFQPVKSKFNRK